MYKSVRKLFFSLVLNERCLQSTKKCPQNVITIIKMFYIMDYTKGILTVLRKVLLFIKAHQIEMEAYSLC